MIEALTGYTPDEFWRTLAGFIAIVTVNISGCGLVYWFITRGLKKMDIFDFIKAMPKEFLDGENGKKYTWECPFCHGTVTGIKSTYNGHKRCKCESCGFSLME